MKPSVIERIANGPHEGGSGSGISYYLSATSCPRRAKLDKELREYEDMSDFSAAKAGVLFHLLAEAFYMGENWDGVIELDQIQSNPNMDTAMHLWKGYIKRFKADEFNVVSCEELLEFPAKTLFLAPFTCRIDMVIDHPGGLLRGYEVEPGIYLVDHKTGSKSAKQRELEYKHSLQFIAYQMAYQAHHGIEPKGMLVNCVNRPRRYRADRPLREMKDEDFYSYLIPYPSEEEQRVVREFITFAGQMADTDRCNPGSCIGMWGPCRHLTSGLCPRY